MQQSHAVSAPDPEGALLSDPGVQPAPPPSPQPLQVVIVSDEDLYRDLLNIALGRSPAMRVVGSVATTDAAIARCSELRPDAVLLNLSLRPGMSGIRLGLLLRQHLPDLGIVLLSNGGTKSALRIIPDRELRGWFCLHRRAVASVDVLHRALMDAVSGRLVLDSGAVGGLARNGRSTALSPRQTEILRLIAGGLSNAAIAHRLDISEKTVGNYITRLYEKLEISDEDTATQPRVKAALHYWREMAAKD